MIHDDARRATGGVLHEGKLIGHCVLVGARQAVTCAHVLSFDQARPEGPFKVCFRNLDDTVRLATITTWSPHDPGLRAGTDIALLTFDGPAFDVGESWVKLQSERPPAGAGIVALDFQVGRYDGDARTGTVHDGRGHVISLAGDRFAEEGMSGGGLFYHDVGAHLLGIVSGKPMTEGQTDGYAIPADEITKLLPNPSRDPYVESLTTLRELALPAFGDNFAPIMRRMFDRAIRALTQTQDELDQDNLLDLVNLQIELRDGLEPDGMGVAIPAELAEKLRALHDVLANLAGNVPDMGELVPFDDDTEMGTLIERAGRLASELSSSNMINDTARDRLQALQDQIACAEYKRKVRLGQLSGNAEAAGSAVGAPFRDGVRAIMAAIGRKPWAAPAGAVFVDSLEPWAPEMVVIPACPGGFLMGSPEDQEGHYEDEKQHRVSIPGKFALGRYALTFDEYDAFCSATGREKPSDEDWGRARHPVINVSWEDAQAWCAWMCEETDAPYRLPSEAEWEYACRGYADGANDTPFCPAVAKVGNGAYITPEEANFDGTETFNGSPVGENRAKTVPVDHPEFKANGQGLWQMHGNVWEWCEDVFEEDYDKTPADGSSHLPNPLPEGHTRVVRGGAWLNVPRDLRSASRYWDVPDLRFLRIGFRPARTLFTP